MVKKMWLFFGIYFLFLLLFLIGNSSALGVSPAGKDYNFEPGLEGGVTYTVWDDPGKELEIFVYGDLAQYVSLDKNTIVGSGEFTAKFKLPEKIEPPGRHRIGVRIAEKIDEELAGGTIGTSVTIISVIDIFVPYPGRYLEINLQGNDVNVGELINFELGITSKGTEDVTVTPKIDIFSKDGIKDTLPFNTRTIASQESIALQKTLNTSNYNPGKYKAVASVDYGSLATSETEFKIGELVINVVNYTNRIPIKGIQKFDISIESGWNDNIDGAYADISIFNNSQVLTNFKTTTTSLIPWETKTIAGYLDTDNFTLGIYDANITLFYYGKDQGKSITKLVKVEFFKVKSSLIWYLIGGAGLLVILALIIIKFWSKHGNKKKK